MEGAGGLLAPDAFEVGKRVLPDINLTVARIAVRCYV